MRRLATLRRTLSLHFLLVAILPTLTLGLIVSSLLHRHLRQEVFRNNQQLAETIADNAELFLREAERSMATLAEALARNNLVHADAVDGLLEIFVQKSECFESILLIDDTRHVRCLGLVSPLNLRRDDYLGADFSRHVIFQRHPRIEGPVWSDTFVSLTTGEPSVTLAMPTRDGVLLGVVNLRALSEMISRYRIGPDDHYAIVDHIGTLVASSKVDEAMQRINLSQHAVIQRALHDGAETAVEEHEEFTLLESTARIPSTDWIVWVGVNLTEKMAPVNQVRDLLAGIVAVALTFAAFVALFDSRRLMDPLSILDRQTSQISDGRYDFRPSPSGFIELDSLARSFQKMAQAVRDRERSLLDSERRFRDLVNSIDGVVWEMDYANGRYLFVSEQSAVLFGFPPARWLDDPGFWSSCVHPEDLDRVAVGGRRQLVRKDRHNVSYRFMTAGGRTLWVNDLVTVIRDGDQPQRLLGVMIDVTLNKQVEAELELYRLHLEELVTQRTAELQAAQHELVQKGRLAVLGQLTATVSHEIRNPLGTVANALFVMHEMLDVECLAKVERPLALAERSVQRCDGIISELLDFTRRRETQKQPLEIDRWLAETLDEMSWPVQVRCSRRLTSGATVQADPERLRRVMVNVITNALQALEEKGGNQQVLEISTLQQADRCLIVVRDSGIGIPEAIREHIFEPLFSTKNFGVGLGVPIICNIMEDHGGGVDYQSEAGEGTTVTLWLPLLVAPAITSPF